MSETTVDELTEREWEAIRRAARCTVNWATDAFDDDREVLEGLIDRGQPVASRDPQIMRDAMDAAAP